MLLLLSAWAGRLIHRRSDTLPIARASSPPLARSRRPWTLQIVASTSTYSKSGSSTRALKSLSQNPAHGPAPEPAMHRAPVAQLGRQVAPGRGRPRQPEHRVHQQPVVRPGPAPVALLARKKRLDPLPLRIRQGPSGVVAQLGLRPSLPLSPWVQATRTISASPRAEKRFIRATRTWTSAVWRSGFLAMRRSPKLLRHPILASARLRA